MLFKKKKDIIGIDIGSSSVKLVQLRDAKGGYQLVTLGMALLPEEAIVDNAIMDSQSIISVIQNLVESLKVKTKNVATSVSGHSVIIRKIQLPIMTEEEMEASIQWEAEQYIPFEISEVNLDFQILGADPNDASQMDVILVAAKKDFVSDYVSLFKECGFNPVVMDIDCFSVENVYETNYEIDDDIVALIDMGDSSMNVNILKGGNSVFTRDIQVGGNAYNEELQKRLGLNNEDAEKLKLGGELEGVGAEEVAAIMADTTEGLTQEVQRSIDFFSATSSDEKVQKAYIVGGVALVAGVRSSLANRLGVEVEVMDPWRQVAYSDKDFDSEYLQAVGPIFAVAAGLAMRRMGDK